MGAPLKVVDCILGVGPLGEVVLFGCLAMAHSSSEKLLFVHIPRTGGGSLINILDDHYDVAEIAPFWNPQDFAGESDHDLIKYHLVRGHCGPNEIKRLGDSQYSTITFLRDPIARTASIYRWLRTLDVEEEIRDGAAVAEAYGAKTPTFDPASRQAIEAARNLSFEDFVGEDVTADFVSNGQTVNLGSPPMEPKIDGIDLHSLKRFRDRKIRTHTLPRAIRFVQRSLMTGIVEKFEESVMLLHYLMGWPVRLPAQNAHDTKTHSAMTQLTDSAISLIKERNRADLALYAQACERLNKQYDLMLDDLGTSDISKVQAAINTRFRDKIFCGLPRSSVSSKASNVWPGVGWEERKSTGQGTHARLFGANNTVSILVTLDVSVASKKPQVLTLFLHDSDAEDPAKSIRITIDGRCLQFGGVGGRTSGDAEFPNLYAYHWSLPFDKIEEHGGCLELVFELVDVEAAAQVSVGAFQIS